MAKKQIEKQTDKVKTITDILRKIAERDVYNTESGFPSDKDAIRRLFALTTDNTKENHLLRLTVIDSMYSTQMNRRYYGLEELANAMYAIQEKSNKSLENLFLEYLKTKDASIFDYTDELSECKKRNTNLLSEKYGIGKDGSDKGVAISLISKYAYFVTGYKFPIFDSIACEMYPKIWKYCELPGKPANPIVQEKGSTTMDGIATMKNYINELDLFIKGLGGNISYDHLDRLLWFVGKIIRGNLSLVLTHKDYKWCTDNLNNCYKNDKNGNKVFSFDIKAVNLSGLNFLEKETLLYDFFEFAKELTK